MGEASCCRALLAAYADPCARNAGFQTALDWATSLCQPEVARLLTRVMEAALAFPPSERGPAVRAAAAAGADDAPEAALALAPPAGEGSLAARLWLSRSGRSPGAPGGLDLPALGPPPEGGPSSPGSPSRTLRSSAGFLRLIQRLIINY